MSKIPCKIVIGIFAWTNELIHAGRSPVSPHHNCIVGGGVRYTWIASRSLGLLAPAHVTAVVGIGSTNVSWRRVGIILSHGFTFMVCYESGQVYTWKLINDIYH